MEDFVILAELEPRQRTSSLLNRKKKTTNYLSKRNADNLGEIQKKKLKSKRSR